VGNVNFCCNLNSAKLAGQHSTVLDLAFKFMFVCIGVINRPSSISWYVYFHTALRNSHLAAEMLLAATNAEMPVFARFMSNNSSFITVRRHALHGLSYRNSVRPSVTLVHCVHMVQPTIMISSPYGSPIILVSGDIKFFPKFEGDHPERGH